MHVNGFVCLRLISYINYDAANNASGRRRTPSASNENYASDFASAEELIGGNNGFNSLPGAYELPS